MIGRQEERARRATADAYRPSRPGVADLWKNLALVALTAAITSAGLWTAVARGAIDRAEAREIVRSESPWVQERAGIEQQLTGIQATLVRIERSQAEDARLLRETREELAAVRAALEQRR